MKKNESRACAIEDYALIGDAHTGALVSRAGSIDWLCWPNYASGACFASLVGTRDHGYWQIAPVKKLLSCKRQYRPHTMILETRLETASGEVLLTEFMPRHPDGDTKGNSRVIRLVTGLRGKVDIRMELAIRFDYGRTIPWVTQVDQELRAVAGPDMVVLRARHINDGSLKLEGEDMTTISDFTLRADESVVFTLTNASSQEDLPKELDPMQALEETAAYWEKWAERGKYQGAYPEAVERSLMTLKALTYQPSGGIVAALTTSLPEQIGGARNWDYRYCWLRDTSFTLLVLMNAGYTEEAIAWRLWLLRAVAGSPEQVQSIYGLSGERQMPEWIADWLPGYEGSLPVRIGNGAANQFQLDVFGEVVAALAKTPQVEDDNHLSARAMQSALVNHLCHVWPEPDEGIWEVRGPRRHFTHSKVMAWVALDRAIKNAEQHDSKHVDLDRWKKNRDLIHKEVCDKGFNKKLNCFTQSYGSKELDASCLRIALVGFLPASDPRIIGTIEAIEKHLTRDGFVLRYDTKSGSDGLSGTEGVFLACSFWMVTCLWLIGRTDDARILFTRLLALQNDVGLLAEEYDPAAKRMLGNFPQALSHIALVHAASTIAGEWLPEN